MTQKINYKWITEKLSIVQWSSELAEPSILNLAKMKFNSQSHSGFSMKISRRNNNVSVYLMELRRTSYPCHNSDILISWLLWHFVLRNASTAQQHTVKGLRFFSAILIIKTSKRVHASPLLAKVHWLPLVQRTEYKAYSVCTDVLSKTAPPYLSDLLHLYIPSRSLRSSADTRTFRIPKRKSSKGNALFPACALSHGINCHTQYAMLQQNSSSKRNLKPAYSSQPID